MLNQRVRPFIAKWHRLMLAGELDRAAHKEFRKALRRLQVDPRNQMHPLVALNDVEDMTDLASL